MFLLYHAWRADSNPPVILLCKLTVFSIVPGRKPRRHSEAILPIRASSGKIRAQLAAQANGSKLHPVAPRKIRAQCAAQAEASSIQPRPGKIRAQCAAQAYGNKLHPAARHPAKSALSAPRKLTKANSVKPRPAKSALAEVQTYGNSPSKPRVIRQNPRSVRHAGRQKQSIQTALAEAQTYRNSPSKPRPEKTTLAEAQADGSKLHPVAPRKIRAQLAAQAYESKLRQIARHPAKSAPSSPRRKTETSSTQPRPAKSALSAPRRHTETVLPNRAPTRPRSLRRRHTESILPSRAPQNPRSVRRAGRRKQSFQTAPRQDHAR